MQDTSSPASLTIAAAQQDMRTAYLGGAPGMFVSGTVWAVAGLVCLWHSPQDAVWALYAGGVLIHRKAGRNFDLCPRWPGHDRRWIVNGRLRQQNAGNGCKNENGFHEVWGPFYTHARMDHYEGPAPRPPVPRPPRADSRRRASRAAACALLSSYRQMLRISFGVLT